MHREVSDGKIGEELDEMSRACEENGRRSPTNDGRCA